MKSAAPAAAPAAAANSAAPAIVGLWNAVAKSTDGDLQVQMEIKQEGATLAGFFKTPDGTIPLTKLNFTNDKLSFEIVTHARWSCSRPGPFMPV
ncbi:MAG: hypothetical protein LAP85_07690 [Acidobacteriia bacterium]|nr:hypothetical protein [Terriglobia bacterium]